MARPRLFLHDSVGPGQRPANRGEDVIAVKQRLHNLGFYQPPPEGFGDDIDAGFDSAVRAFQTDNGLQVDGRLEPGGETERNLAAFDDDVPEEAGFALEDLALTGRVGARGENNKEDVTRIKQALAALGRYPLDRTAAPPPYVDTKLVEAIRQLQRDQGLTEDGFIDPEGETLDALKKGETLDALKKREGRPGTRPGETQVAAAGPVVGLIFREAIKRGPAAYSALRKALRDMGVLKGGETVIEAEKRRREQNPQNANRDPSPPLEPNPPFPGDPVKPDPVEKYPAQDPRGPGVLASPGEPISLPTYTEFPIPDDPGDLIEIFPDLSDEINFPTIFEDSRGLEPVPTQNTKIRGRGDRIVKDAGLPISHVGGARDDRGNNITETYLPHPVTRRKGSARPDISFECATTKRRLYINTVDTKADGRRPSTREQGSAVRIILNSESGDILLLIPKPPKGQDLDYDAVEKIMRPLLHEICEPEPEIDPRTHTAPEDLIRDMFKGK